MVTSNPYAIPDYGGYERQRGDVNYKYSTDSATNAYSRFISQQRGERNLGDMSQAYGRAYPGYKANFGQRGLSQGGVNSGAMHQSMQRYVGDYARDYGRAQQDMTLQNQQYDMSQKNLDQWRQKALQDIETTKADDIANAALNLQYWKQAMGGI
jgi:hypothetical protein